MYTVSHAARLTGIPAETLRMWERRYAIVTPTRSEGGYRLYDDAALRRLSRMRSLVDAGWSPAIAASHVLEGGGPLIDEGGAPTESTDGSPLVSLAVSLDPVALERTLDSVFASATFEELVDSWLMPSLRGLGAAWESGQVSVAGEHFVSAGVHRRVAQLLSEARTRRGAPRVAVGLARSSRHELGVLSFAAVLRRAGIEVVYVGSDLPVDDWVTLVQAEGCVAAVLAVPTPEDVPGVRDTVAALAAAAPAVRRYIGGRHQAEIKGSTHLGHEIVPAASTLADDLRATAPTAP